VPDAAGTAAGLHATTDALIPTTAAIVTALFANASMKEMLAFARGKVVITGSTIVFYDTDDTTPLYTLTISAGGRTVA